jgi:hypothetical protein
MGVRRTGMQCGTAPHSEADCMPALEDREDSMPYIETNKKDFYI